MSDRIHDMGERALNGFAVAWFGLRIAVMTIAGILALPSLGLMWLYMKMGGE